MFTQQAEPRQRTLAQKSKILIFDEPTANLDPKNTALFVKEFSKLRQKHKTILITHDIQLASYFTNPVLFIKDKKSNFYEKDFFNEKSLSKSYGIKFINNNGCIGVSYE